MKDPHTFESLWREYDLTEFSIKVSPTKKAEQKLKNAKEELAELKRKAKKVKFSEDELNELIDMKLRPLRDLNECLDNKITKLKFDNEVLQKAVKRITLWTLIKKLFKRK